VFLNNPLLEIYYDQKDKNTKVLTFETLTWKAEKNLIIVPTFYISDGASIPMPFWQLVGHPLSGQNIRPALLHDYLCQQGQLRKNTNDPLPYTWQEVHELFRQALIFCRVPKTKAKLMHDAVYGRWVVDSKVRW